MTTLTLSRNSVEARQARGFRIAFAVLIAAGLAAPHLAYPVLVMQIMCFGLFAAAFNLLMGYGGLLSFGHAAFFGAASYICAHMAKVWNAPPELAILGGTFVATLLGLVFGALAIRRQGIYFAMVTLALAQLVYFGALQAEFTHGEDGIQGVPRGAMFGFLDLSRPLVMYHVTLGIFLAALLFIRRVIHSPFGQVLRAIRENEPRAISLGYSVDAYKLIAFVISAGLAGLAGATKAIVVQVASLTDVQWQMSGEVVLMALLGGIGTFYGPLIGAAVIVILQNEFADTGSWVTIITGAAFVLCVLTFRRGMVGEASAWIAKLAARDR